MHVDIVLQHLLTETEHMRKKNQQVRRRRRWYAVDQLCGDVPQTFVYSKTAKFCCYGDIRKTFMRFSFCTCGTQFAAQFRQALIVVEKQ